MILRALFSPFIRPPHRLHRALLCLGFCLLQGCAAETGSAPVRLQILAFNDFHGHLSSPDGVHGGVLGLAERIAEARRAQPNTLLVSAGDLVGASPLVSALFFDEPTIEAMNQLGLDFSAVGNHEFDAGSDELLRLQGGGCRGGDAARSCRGAAPFTGARFTFLAANTRRRADDQPLLPPYGIRKIDGAAIAFIGATLRETPLLVRKEGVASVYFQDEAEAINALLPALRRRGAAAVVVLLHQGGQQTGADADGCAGGLAGSPLAQIVGRLDDGVDLVVSGHTHAAYICRLPNRAGRPVAVTSAAAHGRLITAIDLRIDPARRRATILSARNLPVPARDGETAIDGALAQRLAEYAALAAPLAERPVADLAGPVHNRHDGHCNNPAGALIADAQWWATADADAGGAQLALMNPGGIRGAGLSTAAAGSARISYAQLFAMQPFGNHLVTLTLSGDQLRRVLEEQFPGCGTQTRLRPLAPSRDFHFAWDPRRPRCDKITAMTLRGAPIENGRAYRITVNDYLAAGGDGFATLAEGRDRRVGVRDIEALEGYLRRYRADPAAPPRSLLPSPHYDAQAQPPRVTAGAGLRRAVTRRGLSHRPLAR